MSTQEAVHPYHADTRPFPGPRKCSGAGTQMYSEDPDRVAATASVRSE